MLSITRPFYVCVVSTDRQKPTDVVASEGLDSSKGKAYPYFGDVPDGRRYVLDAVLDPRVVVADIAEVVRVLLVENKG